MQKKVWLYVSGLVVAASTLYAEDADVAATVTDQLGDVKLMAMQSLGSAIVIWCLFKMFSVALRVLKYGDER